MRAAEIPKDNLEKVSEALISWVCRAQEHPSHHANSRYMTTSIRTHTVQKPGTCAFGEKKACFFIFFLVVKDEMDNRGMKYSKWNPAKYGWGMLGREMERQRERATERGRAVGFIVSPVKWTRNDWCSIRLQWRQTIKTNKAKAAVEKRSSIWTCWAGDWLSAGREDTALYPCRWAITSPLLMLPPASLWGKKRLPYRHGAVLQQTNVSLKFC